MQIVSLGNSLHECQTPFPVVVAGLGGGEGCGGGGGGGRNRKIYSNCCLLNLAKKVVKYFRPQ